MAVLSFLFLGGPPPDCPPAADFNQDAEVNLSDPVAMLWSLFLEQAPLAGTGTDEVACW
jgi:hypothetical protein